MQIIWFGIIIVLAYFGSWLGFKWWLSRQTPVEASSNLISGATAFFVGGLMLALASCVTISQTLTHRSYATIILPLFLILYICVRCPRKKLFFYWAPLVCAVGTYALQVILPEVTLLWPERVIAALIWLLVMGTVVLFDRLPFVSTMTVTAWAIMFCLVNVCLQTIPMSLAVLLGICAAVLWGIERVLSTYQEGHLGYCGACVLGFVMGAVVAGSFVCGAGWTIIPLVSYYLFEIFLLGLTFLNFHPLKMNRGQFAFEAVLSPENSSKIVGILFGSLLILSLLGTVLWAIGGAGNPSSVLILTMLILVNLYNRYRLRGAPLPTYKDLWNDTVDSVKGIYHRCSGSVAEIKEKTTVKKSVAQKKSVKHKRKKKK